MTTDEELHYLESADDSHRDPSGKERLMCSDFKPKIVPTQISAFIGEQWKVGWLYGELHLN